MGLVTLLGADALVFGLTAYVFLKTQKFLPYAHALLRNVETFPPTSASAESLQLMAQGAPVHKRAPSKPVSPLHALCCSPRRGGRRSVLSAHHSAPCQILPGSARAAARDCPLPAPRLPRAPWDAPPLCEPARQERLPSDAP